MKIKKYKESNKSGDYDYEYGGHAFVLARPKNGWEKMTGSMFMPFKNNEFVPCMVSGHILNKWDKQQIKIIGDSNSHDIDTFEIVKNSDKGFNEMIQIYSDTNKYNL